MEEVFKRERTKFGKWKYTSIGYNHPDLHEGIWLIQKKPYGRSTTSLLWLIGDILEVDVQLHATIQSFRDEISTYIGNLTKKDSVEYTEAKEICGGYLKGVPEIYNISNHDLTILILRQIAILTQGHNIKPKSKEQQFKAKLCKLSYDRALYQYLLENPSKTEDNVAYMKNGQSKYYSQFQTIFDIWYNYYENILKD